MPTPSSPLLPDERPAAETARLANRFAGRFAPETVLDVLADSHTRLAEHARVGPHPVVPAERLDALAEAGVDLADAYLKPLTEEVVQAADIVITMGCGDACPAMPGRRYLDRSVADPDGTPIAVVRDIRNAIDADVTELLTGSPPEAPQIPTLPPNPKEEHMSSAPAASVLFVCIHNAGRSQMAAGFLRHLAGDRVEVRSAGSAPGAQINPSAVAAMAELGIDISDQKPKVLTPEAAQASDYIITMGCGDACPYFPGKTYLDWQLEDPAGQGVEAVRPIRDEIKGLIEGLITEIDAKSKA